MCCVYVVYVLCWVFVYVCWCVCEGVFLDVGVVIVEFEWVECDVCGDYGDGDVVCGGCVLCDLLVFVYGVGCGYDGLCVCVWG